MDRTGGLRSVMTLFPAPMPGRCPADAQRTHGVPRRDCSKMPLDHLLLDGN